MPCGLSAIHLRHPTRDNNVSGPISNSTGGLSGPLGGPSAIHVFNPPETATSLDKIPDSTTDCPHPSGVPSAVQSCEPPPETSSLDKLRISTADRPLPYSGLSAVHSAKPPETTSSLDKTQSDRRTVRASQADRPQYLTSDTRHRRQQVRRRPFTGAGDTPRKGKKTGKHKELTMNLFPRSVRVEDDRGGGSTVNQASSTSNGVRRWRGGFRP